MREEGPSTATLLLPPHTPRLQVQVATQLGARASLELSLRSWLRLASRSLSSVSSCMCSVCASMRRDSLCSTADRQQEWGLSGPVPPIQLSATGCYEHPPRPSPPRLLQLLPPATQGLPSPTSLPLVPRGFCVPIPLR